jgi:hypothetical protein
MRTLFLLVFLAAGPCVFGQFVYVNQPFIGQPFYTSNQQASDIVSMGDSIFIAQIGFVENELVPSITKLGETLESSTLRSFHNLNNAGLVAGKTVTTLSSGNIIFNGTYVNADGGYGFAYLMDPSLNIVDSVFFLPTEEHEDKNSIFKIKQTSDGRIIACGTRERPSNPWVDYRGSVDLHELFSGQGTTTLGSFFENTPFGSLADFELINDSLAFVCGRSQGFYNSDIYLFKCNLNGDSLGYLTVGGPCSESGSSLARFSNGMLLLAHEMCLEYVPDEQGADSNSPMRTQMTISVIDPISFEIIQTYTYNHPILDNVVWGFGPYTILPTSDGGALVLMTCGYSENVIMRPMALKVNANMEQEWFEAYFPQAGSNFMSLLANAVEWRGGYLAAGFMQVEGENDASAWLASIDACGKMEDLGCFPQDTVGVAETLKPSLKMWPQPASDILHLSTDSPVQEVRVWDTAGRLVLHETWAPSLSVSSLQPGLYLISVALQDGGHIGSPLVVETR